MTRTLVVTSALGALLPGEAAARGLIELVADQNAAPLEADFQPGASRLARSGNLVFFVGRTAELGQELWVSDGTSSGTRLVEDIFPGKRGSSLSKPFDANGIAYFSANDGVHGPELWRSDGTRAGTRLVSDLYRGPEGSRPQHFAFAGGVLYFAAFDEEHGEELWRTDGTRGGTRLVADIRPGSASSELGQVTAAGDRIFFRADDGVHGAELWVSDGTAAGTRLVRDVLSGSDGALERHRLSGQGYFPRMPFVVLGDSVYFEADDGVHGAELWRSDGTAEGTVLVRDHLPGPGSGGVYPRTAFNGRVIFVVSNIDTLPPAAPELWSTDGTDAGTFRLTVGGTRRHDPLVEAGGRLYFVGSSVSTYDKNHELWVTDGTPAGTQLLRDVHIPGGCSPGHAVGQLTAVGNRVFFVAREPGHDQEVWVADGTAAGTRRVADIVPGHGSNPQHLTALGNRLLFTANDRQHGQELWVTDGTAAGTTLLADLFHGTDQFFAYYEGPSPLVSLGEQVFYAGDPPLGGTTRLYRSDGTASGTGVVPGLESVPVDPVGGDPLERQLAATRSSVFLLSTDAELWRTNGTASGTVLVHDFQGVSGSGQLLAVGDTVYIVPGPLPGLGSELWKTDGTTTSLVADIVPGSGSSSPRLIASVGNTLFFLAADADHGYELWATDGTAAGTRLVRDIRPGRGESLDVYYPDRAVSGSLLYFVADDGVHGRELWRSDGTEEGTFLVLDIAPGDGIPFGSSPRFAPLPRGRVLFWREGADSEDPDELWVSDGTSAGTRRLESFAERLSFDPGFVSLDGAVYFVVQEIDRVFEDGYTTKDVVWRSDGTEAGTRRVADPDTLQIAGLTVVDGRLYFGGRTPSGEALFVSDGTSSGTRLLAPLDGDFGNLQVETLTSAAGRLFLIADDRVHGNELWTVSCGNGVVEHDEQCDAGASNGSGSCSATCEGSGGRGAGWLAGLRDGPAGSPPSRNGRPIRLPQR